MGNNWKGQPASRLGRSIVTSLATAQVNTTLFTTPFSAQTYQLRIASTLGIWATIGSTAGMNATAEFAEPVRRHQWQAPDRSQHQQS